MSHRVGKSRYFSGAAAIVVLSILVFAPACGQNAHVTRPGANTQSSSSVKPADTVTLHEDPGTEKPSGTIIVLTRDEPTSPASEPNSTIPAEEPKNDSTPAEPQIAALKSPVTKKQTAPETPGPTGSLEPAQDGLSGEGGPGGNGGVGGRGGAGTQGIAGQGGAPGEVGPQGETGPTGETGTTIVTEAPTPSTVIIYQTLGKGEKGDKGCGNVSRSGPLTAVLPKAAATYTGKHAVGRAFSDYANSAVLPYRDAKFKVERLPMGASNRVAKNGERYTENALTLFSFDLSSLPKMESIKEIKRADIVLSIKKVSVDHKPDTELLCFTDERICSGQLFDTKGWMDSINPLFFNELSNRATMKQAFSEALTDEFNRKWLGGNVWENENLIVSIADILSASRMEGQVKELLFGRSGLLNIAVGDDTYVKSARLELVYTEDTCVSGNEMPAQN